MEKKRNMKIVVAMSGGVDSSVAAALLKKQGFDVIGIMMKFWSGKSASRILTNEKDSNRCCSVESEKLARMVAKKIGIPFYVINVEKEFKKKVVDYFLREYKKGNTPNPCVVCNKEIKFGILIQKALSLGADFVATGHYCQLKNVESISSLRGARRRRGNPDGEIASSVASLLPRNDAEFKLLKGADSGKDQSYFLWQLNQKQLSHVLFPVGGYTKPQVRKLAKKFKLPTAETPESQEVCFVQDTTNNFLKKYLKQKPGKIINAEGKVLGQHNGLWFYTIGQRRGLEIQQGPWFVVGKDFRKNILVISKNQKDLLKKELVAKNVNWISGRYPNFRNRGNQSITSSGMRVEVKIRYKSEFSSALIRSPASPVGGNKGGGVKIVFKKLQKAITPGQSAVFYQGEELLGGGVIQ